MRREGASDKTVAVIKVTTPSGEPIATAANSIGATARKLSYSIRLPNGVMPFVSTVFGSSPDPQIRNDPKSLYHSPSGAVGPAFTHSCSFRRSWREI